MFNLFEISTNLLLEQNSKITDLRKAIIDRKPISIRYSGPPGEVISGPRYDIEPVILGTNAKSGNLVIWAYVFKGVSKKGIPGWKMFRVDRIESIDTSKFTGESFKLTNLPGYQRGKAPNAIRSLSKVDIYSPYWFEGYKKYEKKPVLPPPPPPQEKTTTPTLPTEPQIPISPDLSQYELSKLAFDELKNKAKEINGKKTITNQEYSDALKKLYHKKENEWKNYQKMVTGNIRPGEGTRSRFEISAKNELDSLLAKNNISISDIPQNYGLSEIKEKFKSLIYS